MSDNVAKGSRGAEAPQVSGDADHYISDITPSSRKHSMR